MRKLLSFQIFSGVSSIKRMDLLHERLSFKLLRSIRISCKLFKSSDDELTRNSIFRQATTHNLMIAKATQLFESSFPHRFSRFQTPSTLNNIALHRTRSAGLFLSQVFPVFSSFSNASSLIGGLYFYPFSMRDANDARHSSPMVQFITALDACTLWPIRSTSMPIIRVVFKITKTKRKSQ